MLTKRQGRIEKQRKKSRHHERHRVNIQPCWEHVDRTKGCRVLERVRSVEKDRSIYAGLQVIEINSMLSELKGGDDGGQIGLNSSANR